MLTSNPFRIRIYELTLVEEKPLQFGFFDKHFPKDPPLLSTCKQIRAEASGVYGKNHLRITVFNLNITRLTKWMRLSPPRVALYENSELILTTVSGKHMDHWWGGEIWENLLTWIDLYRQGRCRRIVDLDPKLREAWGEERLSLEVELAVKVFDMVDELLEKDNRMSMSELRKAVSIHRRTMSRLCRG